MHLLNLIMTDVMFITDSHRFEKHGPLRQFKTFIGYLPISVFLPHSILPASVVVFHTGDRTFIMLHEKSC